MGIGNTMKHMFDNTSQQSGETRETDSSSRNAENRSSRDLDTNSRNVDSSQRYSGDNSNPNKLPPGTGPGTSGKPGHQIAMEQDLERARGGQGAAGFGTDAAAASGGSLAGTHQGARTTFENYDDSPRPTHATNRGEREASGHAGVLDDSHTTGHRKRDVMPTGDTTEDTRQLHPVTHEYVRHLETEEIERVKERDRHIHHVQHHTQPITASETLAEKLKEFVHPVTHIEEQHVNKNEDNNLFEGQVHQHRDSVQHAAKERTIVDKGTVINETVHHHVHHVIQPVIEKETIDRTRIHTTIPIKEVTQEAPIIHQSQSHAPIPLDHFVQRGGSLQGGVSQDEISRKVLQTGECTREVDGAAEELAQKLHLGDTRVRESEQPNLIETKVTKKATTTIDPDRYQGQNLPSPRN